MCRAFETCGTSRGWRKKSLKKALKTRFFATARARRLSHKFIERVALCAREWHRVSIENRGPARARIASMQRRSRLQPIELSVDERSQLESWSRSRRTPRSLAMRARIVLRCRGGCSNREVARRLRVTTQTVGKWRGRFVAQRLRGLRDQPRPGAPRSISDALVEAVIAKTLHEQPPDAARWSSRRLATAFGISQRAVLRIWHTFGI
jgi:transposase